MDIDMTKEHFNPNRPILRFVERWKSFLNNCLLVWKFLKSIFKMQNFL